MLAHHTEDDASTVGQGMARVEAPMPEGEAMQEHLHSGAAALVAPGGGHVLRLVACACQGEIQVVGSCCPRHAPPEDMVNTKSNDAL